MNCKKCGKYMINFWHQHDYESKGCGDEPVIREWWVCSCGSIERVDYSFSISLHQAKTLLHSDTK